MTENSFLWDGSNLRTAQSISVLSESNNVSEHFGLILNQTEMLSIVERRDAALRNTGRIEFGEGIFKALIDEFCDSAYLTQRNYAETMAQLTEIFYQLKNETNDRLSDEELLAAMRAAFDGIYGGDVQSLLNLSGDDWVRISDYLGSTDYIPDTEREAWDDKKTNRH